MSAGRIDPPWWANLERWLLLQQRVTYRFAEYLDRSTEDIKTGIIEPRKWLEGSAELWSDLVGDVGDWMEPAPGRPRRAGDATVRCYREQMRPDSRVKRVRIEVPSEVFGDGAHENPVRLVTDGLTKVGGGFKFKPDAQLEFPPRFKPGTHLEFTPRAVVTRAERRRRWLRLHHLPGLNAGEVYAGLVWAVPVARPYGAARVLIAVVELKVV